MNKGLIAVLVFLAFPLAVLANGEIYKIVNPDGSITFTDQRPAPDAKPMELKPLSVVETDIHVPEAAAADGAVEESKELTARDLRRMYGDFRIVQPQNEETFWGTGNQVTVSWGASEPIRDDLRVLLYVNGEGQSAPASGSTVLSLDRGTHEVYAVIRDARNRRVVASEPVTFFVKQHSVNFNRPVATPRN
jgi:hypothetical protein